MLEDILGILYQKRTVADQSVGASRGRRTGLARHRKHVSALLTCMPRGNQGSGPLGRLDNHNTQAQSADDAVPLRENSRLGFGQRWSFTDQSPPRFDALCQFHMLGRIHFRQTAPKHRDRAARAFERLAMANSIDASSQSADNRTPIATQTLGQSLSHVATVSRRVACPNHPYGQRILRSKLPLKIEH